MKKLDINNRRFLGSKYKLLNFIDSTIANNCSDVNSVVDLFGGTGVVANHFLKKGKEVYVNDILKSSFNSFKAWFGEESIDLNKLDNLVLEYNSIEDVETITNYFSQNFSNTYFSENDCKKIGWIREDIENKFEQGKINEREKSVLIASLVYSMDRIANTVGHYDAYRKLKNIEDKFCMYMINVDETNAGNAHIFNKDSNELVKEIQADLIYIDPLYNSRQYGDSYHLLENVVCWEKPKVFGVAKKMDRTNLKSNYCTQKAVSSFQNLIENCNCKYILVSYNNTRNKANGRSNAKISDMQIKEILGKKGNVKVFEQEYNNFTAGKSISEEHKERLFLCEVNSKDNFNEVIIEEKEEFVKSPLNYVGRKYKLLPQLESKFPKDINTFVDFFCGGANVACNVKAKKIIAIDNQTCLIEVLQLLKRYEYTQIVEKIEEIIDRYNLSNTYLHGYEFYKCDSSSGLGKVNKDSYLKLRSDYNKIKETTDEKVFMFLTLIIFGFNHQIRFNNRGMFNIPVGKRDFNLSIRKNLLNFCEKLSVKQIDFIDSDYKTFELSNLTKEDFCYLDPPYYLGDACYNENDGWNEIKEKELFNFLNEINSKGIKFALSNVTEHKGKKNDLLINWVIENQYNLQNINCNYSNSNYHLNDKTQISKEVLITNY